MNCRACFQAGWAAGCGVHNAISGCFVCCGSLIPLAGSWMIDELKRVWCCFSTTVHNCIVVANGVLCG